MVLETFSALKNTNKQKTCHNVPCGDQVVRVSSQAVSSRSRESVRGLREERSQEQEEADVNHRV